MDIPLSPSYKTLGWYTGMWRRFPFHTFLVVLLALQFLIPPSWVKYGLDCLQRCRLAATTGSHCPLMYDVHQSKSQHHCQDQTSATSSPELRCGCPHSSTSPSSLDVVRFVLPQLVLTMEASVVLAQSSDPVVFLVATFIFPPDPPPRSLTLSSL